MAQLLGLTRFKEELEKLKTKYGPMPKTNVVVGFTQRYALWVHENMESHHPVGQAKYLEQPKDELSSNGELARIVETALKRGFDWRVGLASAGLRLQREAQELVPVDTSALKASAFTCFEQDLDATAQTKFAESEAIRVGAEGKTQKYAARKGVSVGAARKVLSEKRHAARQRLEQQRSERRGRRNS